MVSVWLASRKTTGSHKRGKHLFAIKRLIGRRFKDKSTKAFADLVPFELVGAKNGDAWVKVRVKNIHQARFPALCFAS
jgi:molecular chaperone DnaK (HSP70)